MGSVWDRGPAPLSEHPWLLTPLFQCLFVLLLRTEVDKALCMGKSTSEARNDPRIKTCRDGKQPQSQGSVRRRLRHAHTRSPEARSHMPGDHGSAELPAAGGGWGGWMGSHHKPHPLHPSMQPRGACAIPISSSAVHMEASQPPWGSIQNESCKHPKEAAAFNLGHRNHTHSPQRGCH